MSWKIQITRAKPNPAGKDKSRGTPIPAQLLGEWVDLKNIGDGSVSFSTLHLANSEFSHNCTITKQAAIYWTGVSGQLSPGEIVRVHTGRSYDSHLMATDDKLGVNYHAYAERGSFVLNNDCGDNLSVWWKSSDGKWNQDDVASYDPNPPEGEILQRVGSKLVPAFASVRRW